MIHGMSFIHVNNYYNKFLFEDLLLRAVVGDVYFQVVVVAVNLHFL